MNDESPKLAFVFYRQEHSDLETVTLNKMSSVIDCRVIRYFMIITSIKSETAFLNLQNEKQVLTQNFTHCGAKYTYSEKYFQSFQIMDVLEQIDADFDAIEQI